MSSDLISRSALMSYIDSERSKCGEVYDAEQILGDIEDMPAAYDVDKVVKQLEEKVAMAYRRYTDCPSYSPCYERYWTQYNERKMCLEIVKGGGVNE